MIAMTNFFDKKPAQPAFQTESEPVSETSPSEPRQDFADELDELQEQDEVEKRAAKAQAYMEAVHAQIFGDDREAVYYEVEKEIQDFAKERLRVYLGMAADTRAPSQQQKSVAIKLPFTEQQIQVLAAWADSLSAKPKLMASLQPSPRGRPTEAQPQEVAQPAATQIVAPQINALPRRPRGRPPGTGKHQRAQQQAAATSRPLLKNQEAAPAVLPSKLPNGARLDPETGKYYLEHETIRDGQTAMVRVEVQAQASPNGAQPQPWPAGHSPLENAGGVNAFRVSQGFENGTSGAMPLQGQLSSIIRHFNQ